MQVITDEAYTQLLDASDMEDVMTAVKKLSELKGVGPATATMILQAKYDKVAFMSDEAMLQVFNGDKTKLKYDNKTCGLFLEKINGLVEALSNGYSFRHRTEIQNSQLPKWNALYLRKCFLVLPGTKRLYQLRNRYHLLRPRLLKDV